MPVAHEYVHDGDNLYLEYQEYSPGVNTLTHRYLHGPAVDQVLLDEDIPNVMTKWLLTDHENSIRDVYELAYGLLNHKNYDSFGRVIGELDTQEIVDAIFGYTGREFDDETGLQYNRARYYDPRVGRFLSQDPSGIEVTTDYNLYRYAGNNPLNATDPTGLSTSYLGGIGSALSSAVTNVASTYASALYQSSSTVANLAYRAATLPEADLNDILLRNWQLNQVSGQISSIDAQIAAMQAEADNSWLGSWSSAAQALPYLNQQRKELVSNRVVAQAIYNNSLAQAFWGDTPIDYNRTATVYASAGWDALRGLGTGGKAVVNQGWKTVVSTISLGFAEGQNWLEVSNWDRSVAKYDQAAFAARIGTEALQTALTGGLSQSTRFGRVGAAVNAFDAAGNVSSVGRGAVDVYNQGGLTWQNGAQIIGGSLGVAGNVPGLRRAAKEYPRLNPLNYNVMVDRSTLSMSGLGGVGVNYNAPSRMAELSVAPTVAARIHGNSLASPRTAYLYRLEDAEGNFLKWGVTQDMAKRYPQSFMEGKKMFNVAEGTRANMIGMERGLVETQPGPWNFERWAGSRLGD